MFYINLECEDGWYKFDKNCYKVFDDYGGGWFSARNQCLLHDSNLASIHSEDEQTFLCSIIPAVGGVWIGAKRRENGGRYDFEWEDGSVFDYELWAFGEPDLSGSCTILHPDKNYQWDDYPCDFSFHPMQFFCKKDL